MHIDESLEHPVDQRIQAEKRLCGVDSIHASRKAGSTTSPRVREERRSTGGDLKDSRGGSGVVFLILDTGYASMSICEEPSELSFTTAHVAYVQRT